MDDPLPSYESVIKQNHWELVARYLPSDDLCSAALVCQKWHDTFMPQLWGNPASHFGVENDTVYVALTRFKRTLPWARLFVRELCYTLHLPPAHAEIYGGPHAEWLRDCLERLPRLQSLIVNGLPFFDHASLLTLRHSSLWWRSNRPSNFPIFGLRLLDASNCTNVTSIGLAEALPHLPDLVLLDLSKTIASKDVKVFRVLRQLGNLRVLKLKSLGLKDADLAEIASSIGNRVRSLDISDNFLTDNSAQELINRCFESTTTPNRSSRTHSPLPPVEHSQPLGEVDVFGTEDLDGHLRKKLTSGFIGSLAIESSNDVGITHLYISNNAISNIGISNLLKTQQLQALDVGTLLPARSASLGIQKSVEMTEERLTPILAKFGSNQLVYLRINYAVVTEDASEDSLPLKRVEMPGDSPTKDPVNLLELEALQKPQTELDSATNAIYELPGDQVQPTELHACPSSTGSVPSSNLKDTSDNVNVPDHLRRAPTIEISPGSPEIKRGPSYAPEPLISELPLFSPVSPALDATGGLSPLSESFLDDDRDSDHRTESDEYTLDKSRKNLINHIDERRARLELRQSQERQLHPGMLPNVRTLILTDVPLRTGDSQVVSRLIQFIRDSAEETAIAKLHAKHTYILPPGRSRVIAEREYARSLFGLQRIVLEMAPPNVTPKKISTSWRQYPTQSSTEDMDSEAFWEAAKHDFSFFGDEECGLPTTEPGLPLAAMDGLMLAPKNVIPNRNSLPTDTTPVPILDVVAEIARFRKERKAAYQVVVEAHGGDPIVEGHWAGEITVMKKPASFGSVDYYGNRFESGWLYR